LAYITTAGAPGHGEPLAVRVAQAGGHARLDRFESGRAGARRPPAARDSRAGVHGDDHSRPAVGALVADALDELVGVALDQPDADAGSRVKAS
jgi:hypothetical protein